MAKRTTRTPPVPGQGATPTAETPTQKLDRLTQAAIAPLTGGLSPVSLGLATADWAWHLALSPGRQLELAALATRLAGETLRSAVSGTDEATAPPDEDPRFRHPAWSQWPFSQMRAGFTTPRRSGAKPPRCPA